jgi:hypothetical protein
MKTFSNYIDNEKLIDELCLVNDELVTEARIFQKLASWFGKKAKNFYTKINNFYDDLYYFPDNVIKAFNGTLVTAEDDDKETIETIVNNKPSSIPQEVINYLKEHENDEGFCDSTFTTSMCVLGIQVSQRNKDKESEDIIKGYFNKLTDKAKKDTNEIIKKTPEKPLDNPSNDDKPVNKPTEDIKKKVDDAVQDVVDDNPSIKVDDEKEKELTNTIFWVIYSEHEDMSEDEITDNSKKLANILINELDLDDELKKKFNLNSLDDLKKKIEDWKKSN